VETLTLRFRADMKGYIAVESQRGWLTSILELGAWFGAIMSGFVAEVLSRKYGVLTATAIFILGVIVQITSITGGHESVLAGRFITYVIRARIIGATPTSSTELGENKC
jgi:MFS family permease